MEQDDYKAVREIIREHAANEEGRFARMEALLEKISTNELAHLTAAVNETKLETAENFGKITASIESVKADLVWIKWLIMVIMVGMIGAILNSIFGFLKS